MFSRKKSDRQVREGLKPLFPRLWRFCLVLTGSREWADDLAQMTCLRALEKAHLFIADSRLDSWLFKMAQRLWINEMRKVAVRKGGGLVSLEDIELPDKESDPETNLFARQMLYEVMALPEAQRIAVVLVYVEGHSYKETAAALDIPIGTVMSRLAAARAKLNSKMNDERSAL